MNLARKIGLTRVGRRLLARVNYVRRIRVADREVRVPHIRGMECRATEPWMLALVGHALHVKPGLFIDIGVNIGQTLIKVKALEADRPYIGFEPNPACVFYLHELIQVNGFLGCTIVPVGIHTHSSVVSMDLFSDSPADTCASVIPGFRPNNQVYGRIYVPVFSFEQVTAAMTSSPEPVGIVKVDVEGAELEVIESLRGVLRRDRPWMFVEVLPVYTNDNVARRQRQDALARTLLEERYEILRVEKSRAGRLAGIQRLKNFGVHGDLQLCDYLLVPVEESDEFRATLGSMGPTA